MILVLGAIVAVHIGLGALEFASKRVKADRLARNLSKKFPDGEKRQLVDLHLLVNEEGFNALRSMPPRGAGSTHAVEGVSGRGVLLPRKADLVTLNNVTDPAKDPQIKRIRDLELRLADIENAVDCLKRRSPSYRLRKAFEAFLGEWDWHPLEELLEAQERYLCATGWSCKYRDEHDFSRWQCPLTGRLFTKPAAVGAQQERDGYLSADRPAGQESCGLQPR